MLQLTPPREDHPDAGAKQRHARERLPRIGDLGHGVRAGDLQRAEIGGALREYPMYRLCMLTEGKKVAADVLEAVVWAVDGMYDHGELRKEGTG